MNIAAIIYLIVLFALLVATLAHAGMNPNKDGIVSTRGMKLDKTHNLN